LASYLRFLILALALSSAHAAGGVGQTLPAIPSQQKAPIALLVDVNSGQILLERDADRRFIPASLTKVMSLYLAFELIDEERLDPQQKLTIQPKTFDEWHDKGSRMFLPHNAHVSVDDLLMGIATVSANDGAIVLAQGGAGSIDQWVAQMNAKARDLGMKDSHFATPNGWPDEGRTYTTARDLVTLARAILTHHPEKYARYIGQKGFEYGGIAQTNHDPMIGKVDGADGIKTGFTSEAGYGFLGSAKRGNQRLAMVVAASNTSYSRAQAARELTEWGFASHVSRPLFRAGDLIGPAQVQNGSKSTVPMLAQGPINASFPLGNSGDFKLTLRYEGPLKAPIAKGEQIAELEIKIDGIPASRVPLVTGNAVEKAGMFKRLFNGLTGIFS